MKRGTSEGVLNDSDKNDSYLTERFAPKARINLNDLLKKRTEEKKVDKKTNLLIFSGASAVAAAVFVILSL
mgnify:CR=1 FL=1